MPKIGLVGSVSESSWISCKSIVKNLLASYDGILDDAEVRQFGLGEDSHSAWDLARSIEAWYPDELIFVDHLPHPMHLLRALKCLYESRPLPNLTFHVFGDFSIYPGQWMSLDTILRKSRLRFICASPRQSALVSRFLMSEELPPVCPFPVDAAQFRYDPAARAEYRTKLGIAEDETAIVYAGRISLQKNVGMLLKEFRAICAAPILRPRLFIAGSFDAVDAPLFGIKLEDGYYYHRFMSELAALPKDVREKVTLLGNYNAKELFGLHNAGDLYCSLSLHHDEDYGMAPAEALMCGAPAVLTDWGGYSSFGGDERDVDLVPVRMTEKGLQISSLETRRKILRVIANRNEDRAARAERFENRISIRRARELLSEIRKKPFRPFGGFNWKFQKHSDGIMIWDPFRDGLGPGSFYQEVYSGYLGKPVTR